LRTTEIAIETATWVVERFRAKRENRSTTQVAGFKANVVRSLSLFYYFDREIVPREEMILE
jgi:hypothetical protein